MPLTTKLLPLIEATLVGGADFGGGKFDLNLTNLAVDLQSGTGARQADVLYSDQRTLAASATEDIDLASAIENPLGGSASMAKVKAILIRAAAANTNNVEVGGASATQFVGPFKAVNDVMVIPPGGFLFVAAPVNGWAVGAGTADLLKIANSGAGTAVTYDLVIIGTSA